MSSSSQQPVKLLFQALSLDCSVLEALLKKHRNSHGRTLYYRRMKMVLKAIQKWRPMLLESDLQDFKGKFQGLQQPKKRRKEEEWSIYAEKSKEMANQKEELMQSWNELLQTVHEGFPEVISRIVHASKALMTEIQRGFFLPFCTVALAALARISCLHKRIGNWAISESQELVHTTQENKNVLLQFPQDGSIQKAVTLFLEKRASDDELERKFDYEALLASIGIASNKRFSTSRLEMDETSQDSENDDKAKVSRQQLELDNENDIGESLVSMNATTTTKMTTEKRSRPKKKKIPASSVVDQNARMMDRLKTGDTTSKGKKKPSAKRKDPSPSGGPSGGDDKKSKKKKKKTKKKGKDFFDSLFE